MAKTKRNQRKGATKGSSLNALVEARKAYKDGASCGDWLARLLKDSFHSDGKFDVQGFTRCLKDNGIDWQIDQRRHGWQGRFRMNGRQKLAVVARKTGSIVISGQKVSAPGAVKRGRRRRVKTEAMA